MSSWYDGTSSDEVKHLLAKSQVDASKIIPETHATDTVAQIKKFATHDDDTSANSLLSPDKVTLTMHVFRAIITQKGLGFFCFCSLDSLKLGASFHRAETDV